MFDKCSEAKKSILLTIAIGLGVSAINTVNAAADEVVVGHLNIVQLESVKTATPHKLKLSDIKPASITTEPMYRGTPRYATISLGSSKKGIVSVVLDTFPGDKLPRVYVDINGNGDISGKSSFFLLKGLSDFAQNKTNPNALPAPKSGLPIGAIAPTVARYEIKGATKEVQCPVLFTLFGDELDYSISVQHVGTLNIGGKSYRIALVDTNANAVFDTYAHASDKPANVNLMIDRNDDGQFDPKREAFDLAKPFRVAGSAYEVASIDSQGTIIALQSSSKRPEGTITPDELAVGTDSIDFIAKTMDGKTVQFPASFKHHVVMLDFWATWCPPCVAEIPNIVAVYNEYHSKGFDILGVSLDKPGMADKVKEFCQSAGMPWAQIYDGLYWNAAIAKLYGIDSIPRGFLVDGDTGTILAMGDSIRGEGLKNAVVKALGKKGIVVN